MIVKKVAKMRKGGGGSFGGLADYIIDAENEGEKVLDYEFTNCTYENDFFMNIKEIETIQSLNTIAKSDKTFHMIVSFSEDENPSLETMRAIGEEFVKSIGFGNHQRLSVIHDNTNNLHMHIAINRIDPDTFFLTVMRSILSRGSITKDIKTAQTIHSDFSKRMRERYVICPP